MGIIRDFCHRTAIGRASDVNSERIVYDFETNEIRHRYSNNSFSESEMLELITVSEAKKITDYPGFAQGKSPEVAMIFMLSMVKRALARKFKTERSRIFFTDEIINPDDIDIYRYSCIQYGEDGVIVSKNYDLGEFEDKSIVGETYATHKKTRGLDLGA